MDPQFNPAMVDRISVLPVLDLRQDKKVDIDVNGLVQRQAKAILQRKRYEVALEIAPLTRVTEEDLEAKDLAWIKLVPSQEAHWIMIFAVHDITRKLTFGSTGNAEISGYFFDRQTGRVWHDKGLGQAGQGGLLGMAMIGTMSQAALQMSVNTCLDSFPKKPKQK